MSRIQLALNVDDIDAAVDFYATLFDTQPAKRRPGYANFAVKNSPVKLVLFETPGATWTLNHVGVECDSLDEVQSEADRLEAAGLTLDVEGDVVCCSSARTGTGSPDPTASAGRTTSLWRMPTPSWRAAPASRWPRATRPAAAAPRRMHGRTLQAPTQAPHASGAADGTRLRPRRTHHGPDQHHAGRRRGTAPRPRTRSNPVAARRAAASPRPGRASPRVSMTVLPLGKSQRPNGMACCS